MAEERDTLAATKLTRTEFAVVRAYAQGMRPVEIANRYLLDPDDDDDLTEHQAVQRILALRDRLVQFALQHDRPDIAEMFEALRGRSDAGMTRRVEALSSIEQLGQGRPLPSHQVSLWFGPSLARRLVAAEIRTIADLVSLANRRGTSWWRYVPRIGKQSAETIVRWLGNQQALPDMKVHGYVLAPSQLVTRRSLGRAMLGTDMVNPVPLELMQAPRGQASWCIELADDFRFACDWVAARLTSPNTWKSYRREVERVLIWAARQARSLRSLTTNDLLNYRAFLADPQPAAFWCGPANPRDKVHWRPFEGPLRTSSCEAAMRIVNALVRAVRADGPVRRRRPAAIDMPSETSISMESDPAPNAPGQVVVIGMFLTWLETGASSPQQRAALAAALLLARHGLRIVEIPALRFEHLMPGAATGRLMLHAKSAARRGDIELAPDAWSALSAHWTDRQISWDRQAFAWNPEAALLAPIGFPATERGRAKQVLATAGYSASGLDQLLRASWKRFAAAHEGTAAAFTPRMLRLT